MARGVQGLINRNNLSNQQRLVEARGRLLPLQLAEYSVHGLNSNQVNERVKLRLTNFQNAESSRKFSEILRANLLTLFNGIVGACFLLLLAIGQWKDALFGLAVIANVLIGVGQEYRSKRALDQLAVMNAPRAKVLRNSKVETVSVEEVLLDDVLVLGPGDQVVADAEILDADLLQVDESLLTGEVEPVSKTSRDLLLAGSGILAGDAKARVMKIGPETYASRISLEARRFSMVKSELKKALDRLILWISIGLTPVVAIVVNGQVQAQGGWSSLSTQQVRVDVIVSSTASIVSMIPQGLVLITSLAFALAAIRLSKQNVLVQELPAVENLARVDVICFDKTGTLTMGEMAFSHSVELDGANETLVPWKEVLGQFGSDPQANATARSLGTQFKAGPALNVLNSTFFSSAKKWSGYAFGPPEGGCEVWVLGAPEILIEQSKYPVAWRHLIQAQGLGQRVLLLASTSSQTGIGEDLPEGLVPRVLVMISEEIRKDSAQTLRYFKEEGVSIRILSGDNPQTVAAVALKAGLTEFNAHGKTEAIDAQTLPTDIKELAEVMRDHYVFGRVGPEQKRDMVLALQSLGMVVAMTGDGVNDALALKKADLGIAMGTGSAATKAVARLVLLDGRFSSLPGVVAEGRKVIANIERISRLFLTKTSWAILLAVVFGLLSWRFPYLPRQLSALDGFTIGLPAIALALLPNPQRYLPGFLRRTLSFAIPVGLIVGTAVIALSVVLQTQAKTSQVSLATAQTSVSFVLSITGLWVLTTISRPLNQSKVLIIAACYFAFVLVFTVPLVADFIGFTSLSLEELVVPGVISLIACAVIDLISRLTLPEGARPHKDVP